MSRVKRSMLRFARGKCMGCSRPIGDRLFSAIPGTLVDMTVIGSDTMLCPACMSIANADGGQILILESIYPPSDPPDQMDESSLTGRRVWVPFSVFAEDTGITERRYVAVVPLGTF